MNQSVGREIRVSVLEPFLTVGKRILRELRNHRQWNERGWLALLVPVVPPGTRIRILRYLGHEIDDSAYVGRSVLLAEKIHMGPTSRIGDFNLVQGLLCLSLEEGAALGHRNVIKADPCPNDDPMACLLTLDRHAAITSLHEIDCSGGVVVGAFATVAGWSSSLLSGDESGCHSSVRSITIGDYCFIGTASVLLAGARVPPHCVVMANSTVIADEGLSEGCLIGGVPAKMIREIDKDGGYFQRQGRFVR